MRQRSVQRGHVGLAVFCIFALMSGGVIGYLSFRPPVVVPVPNGGLIAKADTLDFGTVWAQEAFEWQVTLKNTSAHAIDVANLQSPCSCTSISPQSFRLKPATSVSISLVLDLMGGTIPNSERELKPRHFSSQIAPIFAGAKSVDPGWTISGRVRDGLVVEPASVDFGPTLISGVEAAPESITVRSLVPLELLSTTIPSDSARASVTKSSDTLFSATVMPRSTLVHGAHSFDLFLHAQTLAGESLPPFRIPIRGTVRDRYYFFPAVLDFGMTPIGSTAEQVVVIKSHASDEFDVEYVGCDTNHVSVDAIELNEDQYAVYNVRQPVTKLGSVSHSAAFRIIEPSGRVRLLELPISYYGFESPEDKATDARQ
jgi:hypothetical protein